MRVIKDKSEGNNGLYKVIKPFYTSDGLLKVGTLLDGPIDECLRHRLVVAVVDLKANASVAAQNVKTSTTIVKKTEPVKVEVKEKDTKTDTVVIEKAEKSEINVVKDDKNTNKVVIETAKKEANVK